MRIVRDENTDRAEWSVLVITFDVRNVFELRQVDLYGLRD